jgi:hypothetical protein
VLSTAAMRSCLAAADTWKKKGGIGPNPPPNPSLFPIRYNEFQAPVSVACGTCSRACTRGFARRSVATRKFGRQDCFRGFVTLLAPADLFLLPRLAQRLVGQAGSGVCASSSGGVPPRVLVGVSARWVLWVRRPLPAAAATTAAASWQGRRYCFMTTVSDLV